MKFLLRFNGEFVVAFEPHEIERQIEFLMSIEPETEEDSEVINAILLQVIADDKRKLTS